ncbi:type II toxin-antitoxin system VapC family toxin [Cyanobium sp. FGCU-6]|nr:type II toxin-antitoxin system VapC family toxin [Cyanobium sp. FGCU6]
MLDTHVLLWALLEPHKLSPELRNALEDSDNTLLVSAASAWEIATKWRLGKLQHARAVVENYAMALHRLTPVDLPINAAVARQAASGLCRTVIPSIACWRPRPHPTTSCWSMWRPRSRAGRGGWRASSPSRRSRSWAGAGCRLACHLHGWSAIQRVTHHESAPSRLA